MAPPHPRPSRRQKPRQTALSFTPKSTPSGSSSNTTNTTTTTTTTTPRKPVGFSSASKRPRRKPNTSILNFFQKVPLSQRNPGDGLFIEGEYEDDEFCEESVENRSVVDERDGMVDEELLGLFEEEERQAQGTTNIGGALQKVDPVMSVTPVKQDVKKPVKGPFMVDDGEEDSEDELEGKAIVSLQTAATCSPPPPTNSESPTQIQRKRKMPFEMELEENLEEKNIGALNSVKSIPTHSGINNTTNASTTAIDEDFIADEMNQNDIPGEADDDTPKGDGWENREEMRYLEMLQEQENTIGGMQDDTPLCPICSKGLEGMKEDEATRHVNQCLDIGGGQSPPHNIPSSSSSFQSSPKLTPLPPPSSFSSSTPAPAKPSAFTHLMHSISEARDWATAALSEAPLSTRKRRSSLTKTLAAAAGTPTPASSSKKRSCPFYKLIFSTPISLTMDAFRYGAIPNVEAYFLSHFHSDHYGGLTGSWAHGLIWCTKITGNLVKRNLGVDARWVREVEWGVETFVGGGGDGGSGGAGETLWVTAIPANHCPGSAIFLFEKRKGGVIRGKGAEKNPPEPKILERVLHTGDFRAAPWMLQHPLLSPYVDYIDPDTGQLSKREQWIDTLYLDTTYLSPKYTFPRQSSVTNLCVEMCVGIDSGDPAWSMRGKVIPKQDITTHLVSSLLSSSSNKNNQPGTQAFPSAASSPHPPGTLLVVIGTYSIGKERICISIAQALNTKIYAPEKKFEFLSTCLDSPVLEGLLTKDPTMAQVHMVPLMDIRPETLVEYLRPFTDTIPTNNTSGPGNDNSKSKKRVFTRVIGFRPTGWAYNPPKGSILPTSTPGVLPRNPVTTSSTSFTTPSMGWTPPPEPLFTHKDLLPTCGSNAISSAFSVPYSEHSSFRELACFVCGVNVRKVVPTVNVGSESARSLMGGWVERWKGVGERRRRVLGRGEGKGVGIGGMGVGWEWEEREGEGGEEGMFMGEKGRSGNGVFMGGGSGGGSASARGGGGGGGGKKIESGENVDVKAKIGK